MGGVVIVANNLTIEKSLPRKYVQFPLFLLHDILENKVESINNILNYGIYRYAMAIEYDLNNVARQICYNNYRGNLDSDIIKKLKKQEFEYFGKDDDYNGFSDENFNPEDEINELLNLFEVDSLFESLCIEFYRIKQALKLLNLSGDIPTIKNTAKCIKMQIKPKEIMPMIGTHLLFDYRDSNRHEFEIIQLLAFVSINSIIGIKSFAKINKGLILNRMFSDIKNDELKSKYEKRHHWEKLLDILQLNWNVNIYSNRTRGIWVSINKKYPLQKLVEHAENIKAKNSIENYKKWKQQIITTTIEATIKEQLNNKRTTS
jgi:hypothetical protein